MNAGLANHLRATLTAVEQIRDQIEEAARFGLPRTASGRLQTPLPPETWALMNPSLGRIVALTRSLAQEYGGIPPNSEETPEPASATLYWISVLLLKLEDEVILDLVPERLGEQFGRLSPEERRSLTIATRELQEEAETLRAIVATARQVASSRESAVHAKEA